MHEVHRFLLKSVKSVRSATVIVRRTFSKVFGECDRKERTREWKSERGGGAPILWADRSLSAPPAGQTHGHYSLSPYHDRSYFLLSPALSPPNTRSHLNNGGRFITQRLTLKGLLMGAAELVSVAAAETQQGHYAPQHRGTFSARCWRLHFQSTDRTSILTHGRRAGRCWTVAY